MRLNSRILYPAVLLLAAAVASLAAHGEAAAAVERGTDTEVVKAEVVRAELVDAEAAAVEVLATEVADTAPVDNDGATTPSYEFVEQQIEVGEWEPVIAMLRQDIDFIEQETHRYDPRLATPLTLLGDALLAKEDLPGALDAYGHALHITRVNDGLHSPSQVAIVHKEADAHFANGDYTAANQREEYAFVVQKKTHGPYAKELLPGVMRLARWYLKTNNVFAGRSLYQHCVKIVEANDVQDTDPTLVTCLRGMANTYRLERFPPFFLESANTDVNAVPAAAPGIPDQRVVINNFPAGERALKRVVKIRRAQVQALEAAELAADPAAPLSPELLTAKKQFGDALIELGDWELMFAKSRLAMQYYQLGQNQHADLLRAENKTDFDHPALLYFPTPSDPRPPPLRLRGEQKRGFVETSYTITQRGTVVGLKVVNSEPKGLMDYRVRKSLRSARYRPAFVEGRPVSKPGHSYRYEFSYYPKPEAEAEVAAQDVDSSPSPADGS